MLTLKEIEAPGECRICAGERFTVVSHPGRHPTRRTCDCVRRHSDRISAFRRSRIPENYRLWEWSDYDVQIGGKVELQRANASTVEALKRFSNSRARQPNVILAGGQWSGKTLLASALLRELILRGGFDGLFVTATELLTAVVERSSYNYEEAEADLGYGHLCDVDWLVVDGFDELAAKNIMPTAELYIGDLFRRRTAAGRGTIITSRRTLAQLKDARYVSDIAVKVRAYQLYGQWVGAEALR